MPLWVMLLWMEDKAMLATPDTLIFTAIISNLFFAKKSSKLSFFFLLKVFETHFFFFNAENNYKKFLTFS